MTGGSAERRRRNEIGKRIGLMIAVGAVSLGVALMFAQDPVGDRKRELEQERPQPTRDAATLFPDLPAALVYRELPKDLRVQLVKALGDQLEKGADIDARRILRPDDGATGIVVTVASDSAEDLDAGLRTAFEGGGRTVKREIEGTRFTIGRNRGRLLAFRSQGRDAFAIFAADGADLRAFAAPFAR